MDPIQAVKDAVAEGMKPLAESVKSVEAKISEQGEAVKGVDERLKKIEALPAIQSRGPAFVSSKEHRGYQINKQLVEIRNKYGKDQRFATFSDEEEAENFIKFILDVKAATFNKDPEAMNALHKRNQELLRTKAAYAEGANATGGFLVTPEYVWDMIMLARERTFVLNECTILPMGSNSLKVPSELTGVSVAWDDEAGAIDESEGTFSQVTLTAKRMNAYSQISNELLADSQIDIVGLLADQFGYAGALELDNEVLNGDGTKLMSGVCGAAAGYSVVLASGSTNFSAQTALNYSDAIYRLAESDAANAAFKINRISAHYLRSLRDSNGQHIYAQPGAGQPNTIWGYPSRVSERITSTSAVSTAFAVFGDWKGVYIGRRMAFGALEVDPYGRFTNYETRYRFVSRWAGALSRATKFCRIITAAS